MNNQKLLLMVSILKIDLRQYIIGFPNPASRHYFFFLPAIPFASDVSSRSRYQNSFLSRQTHFFSGWTRFLRVRVSTTIRSLLTIRLRQSVQFVKFFLFWVSFSQSKKSFLLIAENSARTMTKALSHTKQEITNSYAWNQYLCPGLFRNPYIRLSNPRKLFVLTLFYFITVFEYILQSPLQHCADLALVMDINMLIVLHIKGHTTHARNSCCRKTF